MISGMLALLLWQQPVESSAHAISAEHVDMGGPLRGADYLLIAEAARRPEMRGAHLSCYQIYVYDQDDGRRVAFVAARSRMIERGTEIVYLPPDPNCRSISFVMGSDGRVARVIRTRH